MDANVDNTGFLGQQRNSILEFRENLLRLARAIELREPHLSEKKQAKINLMKASNSLSQATLALKYMMQIDQGSVSIS